MSIKKEKKHLDFILNSLSQKEKRNLQSFLNSPYFKIRPDVVAFLLDRLEVGKPMETAQTKKISDKQTRYLRSWSLQAVYQFLEVESLGSDPAQRTVYLLKKLREDAELETLFLREWNKAEQKTLNSPIRDSVFFKNKSALIYERIQWQQNQSRNEDFKLVELTDSLTIYHLAEIFRHACSLLSYENIAKQKYPFALAEMAKALVDENVYLQNIPAIQVYYLTLKAFNEPLETQNFYFQKLQEAIGKHHDVFPVSEIRDIYLFAINFCIKKMNQGRKDFIKTAFDLYSFGLQEGLLLDNDQLTPYTYNNILLIALALDYKEWALSFLDQYKTNLPPKNREGIYLYNLASYHFRTKDNEKALELLRNTDFSDPFQQLDSRRMLLKIYYEMDAFQAFDSLMESFRIFLYRKNTLGYHRTNYLNLIKVLRRIRALKPGESTEKRKIVEFVASTPALAERDWLLEILG